MGRYILNSNTSNIDNICEVIYSLGGSVEYKSPILPIIGYEGNETINSYLSNNFNLSYITESQSDGYLLEEEGGLMAHFTPLQLLPKIDFSKFRKVGLTGWGKTIAILDSGISEEWVKEHYDFTGFGSSPVVEHGDKVGNIIKRFARGSQLIDCKVAQYFNNIDLIHVLKGIDHSVETLKADVINLSLGFNMKKPCSGNECPICQIVNAYAVQRGVIFVVAAGNNGEDGDGTINCPGKAQEVITVGSIAQSGVDLAEYSSKGEPDSNKPNIVTTGSLYYNGKYDQGTSYSTPIVTGILAAILSSGMPPQDAVDLIYSTAQDLGMPKNHQGFGKLDSNRILEVFSSDESNNQSKGQDQG